MFGSSTASVLTGGATGSPGATSSTSLLWNGSSWTSITEMGTDRNVGAEAGISTLGIIATGGYDPGQTISNVEQWNGSAWTEVSDVNTARAYGISSIAAGYNSYIICSGAPIDASPLKANTEFWDGSSWTELADLASAARSSGGAGGSSASALIFGGLNPSVTTDSFEWSGTPSALFQKTVEGQLFFNSTTNTFKETLFDIPAGTWSSGGSMNTQGYQLFSLGTQTAAIRAGGYGGPPVGYQGNAEQYNGSSWTALSAINDSRSNEGGNGSGTVTAGLIYGGNTPPRTGNTESWDGSSWTEVADLSTARSGLAGVGTSTASLAFLGQDSPSYTTKVESWNGSSWTETTDANTARGGVVGIGQVYTAALAATGYSPSPPAPALVEDWNGTAWTEVAEVNTGRPNVASRSGTSTNGLIVSGGSRSVNCELWNGSSWTEIANVATGRYGLGGQGATSTAAVAFGGNTSSSDPAGVTTTEEFTVNLSNKTITAS
tara:strand:+ start:372 stop:1841 length:1470 start_codon:yes stop_codon:yes gene_type:complete